MVFLKVFKYHPGTKDIGASIMRPPIMIKIVTNITADPEVPRSPMLASDTHFTKSAARRIDR